ncbi:thiol reductant ABC exporter subunit CydC [Marinobacter salinexigens]|uniref:Thiol reductant ABC exporter subunit CydC n=1 Tax=Marinobacter salinexigens TaxID=2919747 RepID=A0A5B0V9A6_9GAMM|nr:thiol reductant ABC exporter subunit CydC [Marinobacter salinexigens]KAA1171048.1 thiol reductant ABC exporter subunit CydC [Marinobacter salinexigens]
MRSLLPWLRLIFRSPGRLATGAILLLLTLLSGIGLLALSGWFITETALVGALLIAGVHATINLYTPGGGIRFFAVARTVTRYAERVYNHDTVLRLLTTIRVVLFSQLSRSGRSHRHDLTGAQWLSRLTMDVDALDTLYLRLIAPAGLALLVTVLMLLVSAIFLNVKSALWLALPLLAAFLLATVGTYLRTRHITRRQSDRTEQLRSGIIEHLEGIAELTAAGRTGKHAARLLRQAFESNSDQARADSRTGWQLALSNMLISLSAVAALWLGLELFQKDLVSGPVMVMVPIAFLGLAEIYGMLPDAFGRLGATEASAGRLNNDISIAEPPRQVATPGLPGELSLFVSDLGIRYQDLPPLMTHFSLQVKRGEHLGIIGHSGSGKSSLADTLAGLIEPFHGSLAKQEACYLTQKTVLFDDTLRANLLLGNPSATDTELWRVLDTVEMADRFIAEADQLDTWLGSAGSRLSGGEARRIALARVLLSPAPLLLLDEPFTGVDAVTRDRISTRLNSCFEGRTVIGFGHSIDALPVVDRVIHLVP